ncbi:serine/threonine protein kinase MST4, putative [Entamoeba invadens IP1]|uniref:Serine/threonine protein kinase MST4, putative n=1 Tax=Entamoeba invadens IP1 TaxID=370355 RepID=L7FMR7_ENTIV|nr:serine/threonine protein kinase MST4, putative [Entamoeba invadens IP1]ELP86770.1 serine/threonine protein kinase MST4, putative [Entamoeba invadens IP1]|eukprot:XP_004253541.1 serine/threonine protein kinase MST4, putative [Entamoeba invadens IP1]
MKLCGNEDTIDELEKEVNMLDKFRSKYMAHLYGAMFITNKVCVVTELAQYGSLQDLIKHKMNDEVDMKMRVKILLKASNVISYLYSNNILHRDIKPDNILVFRLNLNNKANAKLTDFGTSRNVNMLMTNMTFTKGVGTPKYMAPEIMNKKHYKKPADVYSFAITMLECFLWSEAFPKSTYIFPWTFADDVASGKRLMTIKTLDKKYRNVIEKCWKQKIQKSGTINEIIDELKTII